MLTSNNLGCMCTTCSPFVVEIVAVPAIYWVLSSNILMCHSLHQIILHQTCLWSTCLWQCVYVCNDCTSVCLMLCPVFMSCVLYHVLFQCVSAAVSVCGESCMWVLLTLAWVSRWVQEKVKNVTWSVCVCPDAPSVLCVCVSSPSTSSSPNNSTSTTPSVTCDLSNVYVSPVCVYAYQTVVCL